MLRIKTVSAAIILFMIFTVRAYSWDLGLGVNSYYSYWEPAFMKVYDNVKVDPALLVGPLISLHFFDNWVLGASGMITPGTYKSEYTINVPSTGNMDVSSDCERVELETSIMYIMGSYFRIFAGYKFFTFMEDSADVKTPSGYTQDIDWFRRFGMQGPGAGIGFTFPLAEDLKLNLSTSLLYFNMRYNSQEFYVDGSIIKSDKKTCYYTGYGNNSTLTFSYFMPSIDTSLNLGARCQYLKYVKKDDAPELDSDLNYGVTLSAMYFI